jgi:hypothetical protein
MNPQPPGRLSLRYNEVMLPFINPAPFLWLLLLFVAALIIGAAAFFLGILKGKEIEARLQRRLQKLSAQSLAASSPSKSRRFSLTSRKTWKPQADWFPDLRRNGWPAHRWGRIRRGEDGHTDEVKTGNSQLSSNERSLRDAIEGKRVRWQEYRVGRDISAIPSPQSS